MNESSAEDVARFFDRAACRCSPRRRVEGRLPRVSRILLRMLDAADVSARSALDVGCGRGGLSLALGQRGFGRVTGVDLSSESIATATRAAELAGAPARFLVANAATDRIEPHDVVILNRVVCCYVDVEALLANTVPAAGGLVALSMPHSRGLRGVLSRVALGVENSWRRLVGDPFRAFLHDEGLVRRSLDRRGWTVTSQRHHGVWYLATFERHP